MQFATTFWLISTELSRAGCARALRFKINACAGRRFAFCKAHLQPATILRRIHIRLCREIFSSFARQLLPLAAWPNLQPAVNQAIPVMVHSVLLTLAMNVSMYQAAAALNANSRWQEVIAENLAASSVPGYKKQQLSVEAVRSGLMPPGSLNSANGPQFFSLPKAVTSTNFASGDMQYTGANTDVAIQGKGFLSVTLPNGQTGLTRDGELQVNTQGQLVTKQGYPVLGEGGPIQLDLANAAPVSISTTGVVAQGATQVGQLKLTEFDKPGLLTQIGGGYYAASNPNIHSVPGTSTVKQGYIEASNTSVITEMTDMIAAQRGFEANTKIIQMQDDRMGKVISDLGTPA
jgi:flagellar basal body rod protein FlgG